ncbi:MAG: ABC transporter substrate-binding protein [Lachnospiraceae bacterium]|jgi:spermidine/putrescine transport system substrate-binding protein
MRRRWIAGAAAAAASFLAVSGALTAAGGTRTVPAESGTESAADETPAEATGAETSAAGEGTADETPADEISAAESEAADAGETEKTEGTSDSVITLRVCSWEEYIDTGGWAEDETIDLESGDIFGENSLVQDFEEWYQQTYGERVKVEYSTFGTNEDLYNMLCLGDTYDLICPSEYMFMKLMDEGQLQPLSDSFFDGTDENNYYIRGVSPYLRNIFDTHTRNGEAWSKYAAGYMWGITGIVYNPEKVTREEASTWTILSNSKFSRQITIKDNVRDSYFAAVAAIKSDLLTSPEFTGSADYSANLEEEMNDTSPEMVAQAQDWLQNVKDNVYSFETDSGKADMISGKVVANYQWSGDAVYTMDQADEDGCQLNFAVPEECTNIYFDGWVMLKRGIAEDPAKQRAAEAFINFLSRPDNAIRNMYYIGYTSVIAGSPDDSRILEYVKWNYGAEDGEEDTVDYDLSYFFLGEGQEDGKYVIEAPAESTERQLLAQYPDMDVIRRASIMRCFTPEESTRTNRMWINVRCYNLKNVTPAGWAAAAAVMAAVVWAVVRKVRRRRAEKKA